MTLLPRLTPNQTQCSRNRVILNLALAAPFRGELGLMSSGGPNSLFNVEFDF